MPYFTGQMFQSLKNHENTNIRYIALKKARSYKIITKGKIPPKTPQFKRFTKGFLTGFRQKTGIF